MKKRNPFTNLLTEKGVVQGEGGGGFKPNALSGGQRVDPKKVRKGIKRTIFNKAGEARGGERELRGYALGRRLKARKAMAEELKEKRKK